MICEGLHFAFKLKVHRCAFGVPDWSGWPQQLQHDRILVNSVKFCQILSLSKARVALRHTSLFSGTEQQLPLHAGGDNTRSPSLCQSPPYGGGGLLQFPSGPFHSLRYTEIILSVTKVLLNRSNSTFGSIGEPEHGFFRRVRTSRRK